MIVVAIVMMVVVAVTAVDVFFGAGTEADQARVDLFCAGHVHGGQVGLPLYGALVTLSRHGKRYEAGLYQAGPMRMYVSRGIGMEGGSAPRVRFCSRPEIAVIEAVPE